jgi:hypothetical protein
VRRLRDRGESLDSTVFRDAVAADIPALAELHGTTWNATYRTSRGPSVATRARQWTDVFAKANGAYAWRDVRTLPGPEGDRR